MAVVAIAAATGASLVMATADPAAAGAGSPVHVAFNGKCLDADLNTINANGTKVQLWDCNGTPQQTWIMYSDGTIHSGFNDKCLDADLNTAGNVGTKVQLWDCNGSAQQRWSFDGIEIYSGLTARCVDADLNTINANGTKVQLWDCNDAPQQTWSGLPTSTFQTSCATYSNGEIWQTSTTVGRVREQPCLQYDAAIAWGVINLQVDYPTSCSVTVGFPPSVSLGCPLSYFTKVRHLSFNSLQVGGNVQTDDGHSASFQCNYAGSSIWGTYTVPCPIGPLPRTAKSFVVNIHDTGGDVTNDAVGLKLLAPGSFAFTP